VARTQRPRSTSATSSSHHEKVPPRAPRPRTPGLPPSIARRPGGICSQLRPQWTANSKRSSLEEVSCNLSWRVGLQKQMPLVVFFQWADSFKPRLPSRPASLPPTQSINPSPTLVLSLVSRPTFPPAASWLLYLRLSQHRIVLVSNHSALLSNVFPSCAACFRDQHRFQVLTSEFSLIRSC